MARGSVYRPTYEVAGKTKKQAVWWIAYRQDGKLVRKSTRTKLKGEAEKQLRKALVDVDEGTAPAPGERVTVADLHQLVTDDYAKNGRRSSREANRAFGYLRRYFGDRPVSDLSVASVDAYVAVRLKGEIAGPSRRKKLPARPVKRKGAPATVNRELAMLRRGFRLAVKKGRLSRRPDFSLLTEHNRRKGFFEVEQFEAVVSKLPGHLQPLMRFLYWTGWRSAEARALEWRQVDRKAGVIRIEDTKSGEPRTIPYAVLPELQDIIESQRRRADDLQREKKRVITHVFLTAQGFKVHDYVAEWDAARKAAGLPGRFVHDFRRTAARNMLRAGIPQPVAMQIGGWKTDSVFRRYAIVDEKLIAENLRKLGSLT